MPFFANEPGLSILAYCGEEDAVKLQEEKVAPQDKFRCQGIHTSATLDDDQLAICR